MPLIPNSKKVIFIVGPTAAGKSEIAVRLAQRLKGEIVSCDSMQIYKGMDIIASKSSTTSRKKIRHHLIDILSPGKVYNVSRFRKEALKTIRGIIKRKKLPILVGGTGLYVSVLIDGIFDFKSGDKAVRKRLYEQAQWHGSLFLYKRLEDIDPEAAAKIHPHDARRIIRAIEVFETCGKPISYLQKQRKGLSAEYDVRVFCVNRERQELYRRIDERVDKMFAKGLEKEVKRLLNSGLSKTACYAIGLKELKGYFEGLYGLEEAKRLIKRNTRQYAKRQLTWFRKDKRVEWIDVTGREKPLTSANRILSRL
jgi:tRNA dimethylallyltransferase